MTRIEIFEALSEASGAYEVVGPAMEGSIDKSSEGKVEARKGKVHGKRDGKWTLPNRNSQLKGGLASYEKVCS